MAQSLPRANNTPASEDGTALLYLPILVSGALAAAAYSTGSIGLRGILAPASREVLHDDFTQYTQNVFSAVGLLFALFLGTTFGFYLQRQERLFGAIYQEVSVARALLEQLVLLGGARQSHILEYFEEYIVEDLMELGKPRVIGSRAGGEADPLEKLLFATSVGTPSCVCDSVRAIRQARAERLAATQRKFPLGHLLVLGGFTVLTLACFPLLSAGLIGFEEPAGGMTRESVAALPGHLLSVHSVLFGLLVAAVILAFVVAGQLADPSRGVFGVEAALTESLRGLQAEIQGRRARISQLARRQGCDDDSAIPQVL